MFLNLFNMIRLILFSIHIINFTWFQLNQMYLIELKLNRTKSSRGIAWEYPLKKIGN